MKILESTVLVTGSNRGLGHHIVDQLLASGASMVYAGARDTASLDSTIALDPNRVTPVQLDITDPTEVAKAVTAAPDVQLLVNNAGVLDYAGPLDLTTESLDRNMATNFAGTYEMTRSFTPVIESNGGGSVVNVLTFLCFVAAPIFSAYNASKAASWSMSLSLRPYLEELGISVVNVFPTTIDTEMVAKLDKEKASPRSVAMEIVAGVKADAEDIFPVGSDQVFADWHNDHKAIEKAFAKIR